MIQLNLEHKPRPVLLTMHGQLTNQERVSLVVKNYKDISQKTQTFSGKLGRFDDL